MSDALARAWRAAVAACAPAAVVARAIADEPALARGAVTVLAMGKAAAAMAAGAVVALGPRVRGGLVVTGDGVAVDEAELAAAGLALRRAGHPVPDARSEAAGRALLAAAAGVRAGDTLLALVSGGASALVAVPRPGLTLAEKVARTEAVRRSGAPIAALNRARGELSAVKGGRLAAACPGRVVTLVASDVPGDDVAVVGSGPTVPGKPGDVVRLVAGLGRLRQEAARALAADGWREVGEHAPPLEGDVAAVAARVLEVAAGLAAGAAWVAGGEWTVEVPVDAGTGGRAVQLALLVARGLAARDLGRDGGRAEVRVLVAGSDGVDGTGPAAGAVVDGATWGRLAAAGIDGERALRRCDAGAALAAIGATVVSGPTGTNHADLVIVARA